VTRIWVINPNTTRAMTSTIEVCARAVAAEGVDVTGVTSEFGPPSIESHYDEAMSVPGLLAAIQRGEAEGVDGYVIACFGDPGLDAAMQTASHLGRGFSIVTTLGRTIGRAEELAERYGMSRFCRGFHACEIPVLDLETDPMATKLVTDACREAVERDRSDAVVLGCAGMAEMCRHISEEIGVPVVDGVTAATLTVQSLVAMGLRTGKRGEFATPPAKEYVYKP
jgi:allantoin racemase